MLNAAAIIERGIDVIAIINNKVNKTAQSAEDFKLESIFNIFAPAINAKGLISN